MIRAGGEAAPRLQVVSGELSEPPYPADIRARGWRFELDYERIHQSETWAVAPLELRPWLLMLWFTSWHQTPIGTLPVDDRVIAAKIGMPLTMLQTHREVLLSRWQRCSDGRLYHDVITERVVEMLDHRRSDRARAAAWRASKKQDLATNVTRDKGVRSCESPVSTTPEPEPEPLSSNPLSSSPAANVDHAPPGATAVRQRHRPEAVELLLFLNEKAGRHYRPTDTTLKPIIARLKEGFTVRECKFVVMRKVREWKGKDMDKYLRPATVFGEQKFSQYIGEVPFEEPLSGN